MRTQKCENSILSHLLERIYVRWYDGTLPSTVCKMPNAYWEKMYSTQKNKWSQVGDERCGGGSKNILLVSAHSEG